MHIKQIITTTTLLIISEKNVLMEKEEGLLKHKMGIGKRLDSHRITVRVKKY